MVPMKIKPGRSSTTILAAVLLATLGLSSCANNGEPAGTEPGPAPDSALRITVSNYPLEFLATEIAGERAAITSLTPPGVTPHDLELSPAQLAGLERADLVFYQSGFQQAIDDALAVISPAHTLDAAAHAALLPWVTADLPDDDALDHHEDEDHGHDSDHEDETEDHSHKHHHEDEHDHDHSGYDPHFWLDPQRLIAVANALRDELSDIDPAGAQEYQQNTAALVAALTELDQAFTAGLSQCQQDTIIVTHSAFGYWEARYGIHQLAITGFSPQDEPSPARLVELTKIIDELGITTVFFETLVSPKVAQTLAAESGVNTAVLDPLEGLIDSEQDLLSVSYANLAALQEGLACQ